MSLVLWCLLTGAVVALVSGHVRLGMIFALVLGMYLGTTVLGSAFVTFLQLRG